MMNPMKFPLREHIIALAESGKRLDGRKFDENRKVTINVGAIEKAEGSAEVFIGKTRVMVGVKMGHSVPYPDSPDTGMLMVTSELVPLAASEFESGPPREEGIELARVIDRGVRESKCIDMDKLCVEPKKCVRSVAIDVWILDHLGNLIVAGGIGAIAALKTAKMAEIKYNAKTEEVEVNEDKKVPVPIKDIPIPCTAVKIGEYLLLDPTNEEELALDARITITTDVDGNIRAMQKGGEGTFSEEEIQQVIDWSTAYGKEVRKLLK